MFKQEGFQFMGAAFEVYNRLGYGMAEEVYQQSLEIELELRSLPYLAKQELTMFYKDRQLSDRCGLIPSVAKLRGFATMDPVAAPKNAVVASPRT